MVAAIMAHGPNDLVIPAMLFTNKEEAEQFMNDLMQRYPEIIITAEESIRRFNETRVKFGRDPVPIPENCTGWHVKEVDSIPNTDDEDGNSTTGTRGCMRHIFTSYYEGCGGVGYIDIQELEFGKPLVRWDLD